MWIISSNDGYWNNEIGWVEHRNDATVFPHTQFFLPIGEHVKWEEL